MGKIKYIDTTKGYLILLVVLGHILIVLNPGYNKTYYTVLQAFIYTFHMPAFFVLHGIVFNMEKWRNEPLKVFVYSKIQTLIIPYCFFELVGIVWRAFFFDQSFGTGLYNLFTIRCNVGADWFLIAMFLGSLLFWVYVKYTNRLFAILTIIICLVLPMNMNNNQLLIVFGRGMLAYVFMMCGCIFKSLFLSDKTKSVVWFVLSLILTAIVAFIGLKFGENDFYSCTVHNPLMLWVGGMSGTVLMIGFSRIFKCKIVTDIIGNHTLTIMGTHQLVIYSMTTVLPTLTGGTIIDGILLLLIIFAFELPVVWFLDQYLGFLTGRR